MFENATKVTLFPDKPGRGGIKTGLHTLIPNQDTRDIAQVLIYNARWRKITETLSVVGTTADTSTHGLISPLVIHNYAAYPTTAGGVVTNTLLGHNYCPADTANPNRIWDYTNGVVRKATTGTATPAIFTNIKSRCFVSWGATNNFIIDLRPGLPGPFPKVYDVGVAAPPTPPLGYDLYGVSGGMSYGSVSVVKGSSWVTQVSGSPSWSGLTVANMTIIIGGVAYIITNAGVKTSGWSSGTMNFTNGSLTALANSAWPDGMQGLTLRTSAGHYYVVGSYQINSVSTTTVNLTSAAVANETGTAVTFPAGYTNYQIQLLNPYAGVTAWAQGYTLNLGTGGLTWLDAGPTYAYAYYDPVTGHMGNISQALTVTETNQTNLYSIHFPAGSFATLGTGELRFTEIVIFRTLLDGGSVLFPLADTNGNFITIASNVATSVAWDDIYPDSYLINAGGFQGPVGTNDPPPIFQHQAYWNGRVWGNPVTDQSSIVFSGDSVQILIGVPEECYPGNNILRIPAEDGRVTGMKLFGDYLIVTTDRYAYYIAGTNETNYQLVKFSSTMFGVGDYQMMEFAGETEDGSPNVVYLGPDWRLYTYSPSNGNVQLSQPIQDVLDAFSSLTTLANVRMRQIIMPGARMLLFCFAPKQTGMSDFYALDYENKVWTRFSFIQTSLTVGSESAICPMTAQYITGQTPAYYVAVSTLVGGTHKASIVQFTMSKFPPSLSSTPAFIRTAPMDFGSTTMKILHEIRIYVSGLSALDLANYPWTATIRIDDGRSVRSAEPFVVMMDQYRAVIPTYGTPVDSPTTAELVWRAALPCMGHRFDIQVTWPANTPTIPLELMSMDIIASLVNEQGPVQP